MLPGYREALGAEKPDWGLAEGGGEAATGSGESQEPHGNTRRGKHALQIKGDGLQVTFLGEPGLGFSQK